MNFNQAVIRTDISDEFWIPILDVARITAFTTKLIQTFLSNEKQSAKDSGHYPMDYVDQE